jgi:hypothetical protein
MGEIYLVYSRSLDMNLVSPTKAYQDKMPMDLYDAFKTIQVAHETGKQAMRVECPVCDYPTGILLVDRNGRQERKCSWCKSESIFVKLLSGAWKIKSMVGLEKIDSSGKKSWRNKAI